MSPDDVLEFWFSARAKQRWFAKETAFDDEIRDRFAADIDRAAGGAFDAWIADPRGALALVIACDQFPRNIYRGSPRAFVQDAKAREVARAALELGHDHAPALTHAQHMFFYMPHEHSEVLADQDRSLALFTAWDAIEAPDKIPGATKSATAHRDIVARFGRFPHRNAALGRESTPAELAFLAENKGF